MTFEGQYLTKQEYIDLGGSPIEEMPFNLLEFEARRKIDIYTFNRVKDLDVIPQEVKLCEYKMINSIKGYIEASNSISANGNVASENTDGYSISYVTANQLSDVVKSMDAELNDIIRTYLLGVIVNNEHLMYCGVE
jgi:hypothetical protein